MKDDNPITPEFLFSEFRKSKLDFGWKYGNKAIERLKKIDDKSRFLEPTIQFIKQEEDEVRSWGTTVLELAKGKRAFDFLVELLAEGITKEIKRKSRFSRFFALQAIANISSSQEEKKQVLDIVKKMWDDEEEDYFSQAGAALILIRNEFGEIKNKENCKLKIIDMLSAKRFEKEYWPACRALRALREYPIDGIVKHVINTLESKYDSHKYYAVKALGSYTPDTDENERLEAIRALGLIIRRNQNSALRQEAVKSLSRITHKESLESPFRSTLLKNCSSVRFSGSSIMTEIVYILNKNMPNLVLYKDLINAPILQK